MPELVVGIMDSIIRPPHYRGEDRMLDHSPLFLHHAYEVLGQLPGHRHSDAPLASLPLRVVQLPNPGNSARFNDRSSSHAIAIAATSNDPPTITSR